MRSVVGHCQQQKLLAKFFDIYSDKIEWSKSVFGQITFTWNSVNHVINKNRLRKQTFWNLEEQAGLPQAEPHQRDPTTGSDHSKKENKQLSVDFHHGYGQLYKHQRSYLKENKTGLKK